METNSTPAATRLIGYARVSTSDQSVDLQTSALERAGASTIFADSGVSGSLRSRPQLDLALAELREGDTLIVWKLDRLGRSLSHLLQIVEGLGGRGIHLRVIDGGMDTSTPAGKMLFSVVGAMAEFERSLIRERTSAGLAAAKARGAQLGRPRVLTLEQLDHARTMRTAGIPVVAIAQTLGISRSAMFAYLSEPATQ